MYLVVEALIPTFFLVGLGLYIRRSGFVPQDQWEGLESLSYWLFFPALIFNVLINANLKNVPLGGMTATLALTVIAAAVLLLALAPVFKNTLRIDGSSYTSIYQGVLRWNGFIALSVVQKLYGADAMALVAIAMAAMIPLINVIVVGILAIFASSSKPSLGSVLINIFKNPLIWASILGLLVNMAEVSLWDPLKTTIEVTARAGLATGLLIVGAGLRLRDTFPPNKDIWIGTSLRLLGMPMIAIGFGLFFGLSGEVLEVAVICTAVPTAMSGYVLAKKMGGNAPLLAAIVTMQTFLSAATIPLLLAFVK
ncbi:MAG TPA: AEC family transporter [Rhizobiales bacterium]|nr:AEC family transporter [Hyphomicrobiales bacterium]